jgi:hypothetical protein
MEDIKGHKCEICGEEIPINWACMGYFSDGEFHAVHLYHEGTEEFEEWANNMYK